MEDCQKMSENAPSDFDLSLTNSRILLGESIAVEKCPICRSGKTPFFCHRCVLKCENLLKTRRAKSLQKGLNDLEKLAKNKEALSYQIKQLHVKPYQREEQQREINARNEALSQLKLIFELRTKELESKKKKLSSVMADNKSSGRRVSKVKSRMATIREKVESMKVKLQENHRRKHEIGAKLEQRKRALVESLESHIFTLSILDTDSEEHVDPVSQELADATSHQFVRGKWSYIEQDEEFSFKILDSSIAASGQCSNLINYLAQSSSADTPKLIGQNNPVFSEWVAVSYASQFTHSLAAILDVHLPYMTYIPKLSLDAMTVESFNNFLAQLNYNIAYLSCSQGVDVVNYDPRKTLHNLNKLVRSNDIGRSKAFSITATSLLNSIEGHITDAYTEDVLLEREGGMPDEDDDWSIVTDSLPATDLPSIQTTSYASQATELMTSAVSVMSSLWPFKHS